LNEVGSVHRTTVGNYESAVTETTGAVLRIEPEQFQILGDTETARLEELVALARDRELVLIDALGISALAGTVHDCGLAGGSVRESLSTGVNVTVVRGDGLVGGPSCGILAGQREFIRMIVDNPLFAAWKLDPVRSSALAAAAFGTTMGTFIKSEGQAHGLSIMFGMVFALMGGCWYPLELFPSTIQSIVKVLPTTWAMQGMLDLVLRSGGLRDILPEAGILLGFAVIFFGVGVWRFRFE